MNVYLDESGDLGFKFDRQYNCGGSSRYLTIAFLAIPSNLTYLSKRIVIDLYKRKKVPKGVELKGTALDIAEKEFFSSRTAKMLNANSGIKAFSITVKKRNVQPHIVQDTNKLYNYMIGLILPEKIKDEPSVAFIPDNRTIKVKSGNSLVDYLQTELWFKHNAKTTLRNHPSESHLNKNLQFVDFLANIIWNSYENNEFRPIKALGGKIEMRRLFF